MDGAEGGSWFTSLVLMRRQDSLHTVPLVRRSLVPANSSSSGMRGHGMVPTRASRPYSCCCELCIQAGAALHCAAKSRQKLDL